MLFLWICFVSDRVNPVFEDNDGYELPKGNEKLFKLSSNSKFVLDDEGDFGETTDGAQPMPHDVDVYDAMSSGDHSEATLASHKFNAYESIISVVNTGATSNIVPNNVSSSAESSGGKVKVPTISATVQGEANVVIYETDDD